MGIVKDYCFVDFESGNDSNDPHIQPGLKTLAEALTLGDNITIYLLSDIGTEDLTLGAGQSIEIIGGSISGTAGSGTSIQLGNGQSLLLKDFTLSTSQNNRVLIDLVYSVMPVRLYTEGMLNINFVGSGNVGVRHSGTMDYGGLIKNILFSGGDAASYYIQANSSLGAISPLIFQNCVFVFGAGTPTPEANVYNIAAGSQDTCKFINCWWIEVSAGGSIIIHDEVNTYPSTASVEHRDPAPLTTLWLPEWFQQTAGASASDIWNYEDRTLTESISGIASDVWSYPTRTITAGGTSPSDIWNYEDRTLTTNELSDGTHLTLIEGTKGTDKIYDIVQSMSGYDDENAFHVQVYKNGTTDPLIGAKGIVRNITTGTAVQVSTTKENGRLNYTINSGTYNLYMQLWGYTFANPITLSVSDGVASPGIVYGVSFDPSATYPDCCTIYGQLVDFKLEDEQDVEVTVRGDMLPQFVEDVLITNQPYTVLSDAGGNFEFYAIKGSQINIKIEVAGIDIVITVPNTDTCQLIDLL